MELILYAVQFSLYPVAAIVICGLFNWVCQKLFLKLLGRSGYKMLAVSAFVGTPIHELGHAAMCLLFGHKIVELVLWQPRSRDGTWGYVRHTHKADHLYQKLGNLFISAGPIFSGMAVLSLLLASCFPNTWSVYIAAMGEMARSQGSVSELISTGLGVIVNVFDELGSGSRSLWLQIPILPVILMISMHMSLSPTDIQNAWKAVPLYLAVTLGLSLVTWVLGDTVRRLVLTALGSVHAFMMAMFTVVLTFSAAQVLLSLLLRWLRSCFGR